MKKKILGAAIAVAVVSSGVGIAFAMKKSKLCGKCKPVDKKEKLKVKELGDLGLGIAVEPRCFVTNIFITKRDEKGKTCCSYNK